MKIRAPIHLLDRLPFGGGHEKKVEEGATHPYAEEDITQTIGNDLLTMHTYDALLAPETEQEVTPYVLLADSLDKLENIDMSPEDERRVRGIAEYDAKKFAASLLPRTAVYDTGIATYLGWNEHPPALDESSSVPPSLKDLLLLAQACDDLQDPELSSALEYIAGKDDVDKEFKQAVELSHLTGGPITAEYDALVSQHDTTTDQADENALYFIHLMREATKHPIAHIERQIHRSKDGSGQDAGGTGYLN